MRGRLNGAYVQSNQDNGEHPKKTGQKMEQETTLDVRQIYKLVDVVRCGGRTVQWIEKLEG